ncbi:glycosyltransferase family 1 protein [Sphingosinicella sp. YJ22]|uniref:glycosyltransferase family 4 protein n=1 Tax=Sphingosinicella sp. YJ22 TaxID=1104780 RepID=UPI00140B5430|nr:glycosyltransferase family 1 protein [Sphingosinicella sp. YJ22]
MKILIVTDAWAPQVNGVVRTLQAVRHELEQMGHHVEVIAPDQFRSLPCPTYPEIRLALAASVGRRIEEADADAIHVATEGPLGLAARRHCIKHGLPFTTAYHTQFPDYVAKRTKLPARWFWRYIRWFHAPAKAVMVSTPTVEKQLHDNGIPHTRHWGRGVDLKLFTADGPRHPAFDGLAGPILLYVGRVAVEKNVEAFLTLDHPGTKVVVGDGPALEACKARFPEARFLGKIAGADLAAAYRSADVFVFPSRTDTFGLVLIESLAAGTPVAAYPVQGPIDVLTDQVAAMDDDLARATAQALTRDRAACAAYAGHFGWDESARQFLEALFPIDHEPAEQASAVFVEA